MKPAIQTRIGDVLLDGKAMDALAVSYAEMAVSRGGALEREFRERLTECSTLAFRVALGVLRERAAAEDVASIPEFSPLARARAVSSLAGPNRLADGD